MMMKNDRFPTQQQQRKHQRVGDWKKVGGLCGSLPFSIQYLAHCDYFCIAMYTDSYVLTLSVAVAAVYRYADVSLCSTFGELGEKRSEGSSIVGIESNNKKERGADEIEKRVDKN